MDTDFFGKRRWAYGKADFYKGTGAKLLPVRNPDGHKGDFGRVSITGGSVGFTRRSGTGSLWSSPQWKRVGVPGGARTGIPYRGGALSGSDAVAAAAVRGKISKDAFFPILERLNSCDAGLLGPGLGRSQELPKVDK